MTKQTEQSYPPLVQGYRRDLNKALRTVNYPGKQRQRLLQQVTDSLLDFLETKADATMQDIIDAYGAPEDVVDAALQELPPAELRRHLDKTRRIKRLVIVLVGLALALAVLKVGGLAISRYISRPYIIEYPPVIIEGPLPTDTP